MSMSMARRSTIRFRPARIVPGVAAISFGVLAAVLLAAFVAALPLPAAAQAPSATAAPIARVGAQRVDAVEAELIADVAQAAPGQPFRIALRLRHDPDWHTYWRNPGDSGLPTRFEPVGPAGAAFDDIAWPAPRRLAIGDLANYGYEGEVVLSRQATLPSSFGESNARFEVLAQWLVCKDVCIPGEASLALVLPVGPQAQPAAADVVARFDDSAKRAPDPAARLQAGWWQQGTQAYVVLPAGMTIGRAEFFPYFDGVVTPAAAQSLVEARSSSDAGAAGAPPTQALSLAVAATSTGETTPDPAAGLLVADGKAIEIGLQRLADPPLAGKVISVAEVVPAAPPPAPGLLDRLRGRGTAGSAAASSASVASASSGMARAYPSQSVGADSGTLTLAIAGALFGGLILNLMPCVFPVIGLKVLSFSQSAGGDARAARRHALAFSAGVVLSFLLMGVALLALRSAGTAAGWGFQMQSPVFVGAMALLFVLIGLNLFGVFETGVSLTRFDVPGAGGTGAAVKGARVDGRGLPTSFWTGVIAVLVATPCTAPFMGSAVGFTMTSPPAQTMLVFAALGAGMAAPYLVLGWAPGLLRWLPRPGPWLLVFKQLLAFPMLATAAWLAWVLTLQTGADGLLRLLMSAILVAFAAWVYGRAQTAGFSRSSRVSAPGIAGLAAAMFAGAMTVWQLVQIGGLAPAATGRSGDTAGGSVSVAGVAGAAGTDGQRDASPQWQRWSAERVAQALAQGRPVLVDFTAAWCISCQANKKLVLERSVMRRAFDANRVALLRADWTSRDPAITAELARFGRNGVPLYLVYTSADEPPRLLPELLTVDIVLAALGASR